MQYVHDVEIDMNGLSHLLQKALTTGQTAPPL